MCVNPLTVQRVVKEKKHRFTTMAIMIALPAEEARSEAVILPESLTQP